MSNLGRFYDLEITSAGEVVTPSDSTEFASPRKLYIGGVGDVAVVLFDDDAAVTFKAVPTGTFLPIAVKKVMLTGTDATSILALSSKK